MYIADRKATASSCRCFCPLVSKVNSRYGVYQAADCGFIVSGTVLAALTVIVLIIRFSVETFGVKKLPWQLTYVQDYVSYVIIGITVLAVAVPEGLPLAIVLSLAYSIQVSI